MALKEATDAGMSDEKRWHEARQLLHKIVSCFPKDQPFAVDELISNCANLNDKEKQLANEVSFELQSILISDGYVRYYEANNTTQLQTISRTTTSREMNCDNVMRYLLKNSDRRNIKAIEASTAIGIDIKEIELAAIQLVQDGYIKNMRDQSQRYGSDHHAYWLILTDKGKLWTEKDSYEATENNIYLSKQDILHFYYLLKHDREKALAVSHDSMANNKSLETNIQILLLRGELEQRPRFGTLDRAIEQSKREKPYERYVITKPGELAYLTNKYMADIDTDKPQQTIPVNTGGAHVTIPSGDTASDDLIKHRILQFLSDHQSSQHLDSILKELNLPKVKALALLSDLKVHDEVRIKQYSHDSGTEYIVTINLPGLNAVETDKYLHQVASPPPQMTASRLNDSFEYDVALSFAGEDRQYVERVAEVLKQNSVQVFYDLFEEAALWGKNLYEHLSDVYHNRARYTVMFISKHYADKVWTNHERQSAQARALTENQEYILPVRFDDTQIPGLLSTIGYVSARGRTPEEIARLIQEKLKPSLR